VELKKLDSAQHERGTRNPQGQQLSQSVPVRAHLGQVPVGGRRGRVPPSLLLSTSRATLRRSALCRQVRAAGAAASTRRRVLIDRSLTVRRGIGRALQIDASASRPRINWNSMGPTWTQTPTRTSSPTSARGSSRGCRTCPAAGDFPVRLATSRTRTTILADLSADLSDTRIFPREDPHEDVRWRCARVHV